MKRIMFSLLLIIITMPISAQYKPSLVDVMDIITNARTYADKEPWSNDKIYQEVKRIIDKDPDYYINKRLSFRDSKGELFVSGDTLLTTAAQYGNVELVKYLIDKGADMYLEGQTSPLFAAAWGNSAEVVDLFLHNDSNDPSTLKYKYNGINNIEPRLNETPLMVAIKFFPMTYYDNRAEENINDAVIALLKSPELDINLTNNKGVNAATYAFQGMYNGGYGCRECVIVFKKLLEKGAQKDKTLHLTDYDVIKILQTQRLREFLNDEKEENFKVLFFEYLFGVPIGDDRVVQSGLDKAFFEHLSDANPQELTSIIAQLEQIGKTIGTNETISDTTKAPILQTVCTPVTFDYTAEDGEFPYLLNLISRYNTGTSIGNRNIVRVDGIDIWSHVFKKINEHPEYMNMIYDYKTILTAAGSLSSNAFLKFLERKNGLPKDSNNNVIRNIIDHKDQESQKYLAISPLITAAQYGPTFKSANINLLLRNGADVNARHPENLCTPLMYAIIYDNWGAFNKLLATKKIKLDLESIENKNALRYAYEKGCPALADNGDICSRLVEAGSPIDNDLLNDENFMNKYAANYPQINKELIKNISTIGHEGPFY